jgi:hypothetical protein
VDDFAIRISPQSISVPIGLSSASFQLSIVPADNSNNPVTVSITGLPAGVSTTPGTPFTVSPGTSQTVTFNAGAGVQPVRQQVSVQATSGTISRNVTLSLSVTWPTYAYVIDDNSPENIIGYSVDANTGAMTKLSAPAAAGTVNVTSPILVATESGGTFLFMSTQTGLDASPPDCIENCNDNTQAHLVSYRVDGATGSWAPVEDRAYQHSSPEFLIGIHPLGKFLYTSSKDSSNGGFCIAAYLIDPITGHLTRSSCSANGDYTGTAARPGPLSIPPPGKFAYTDGVVGYTINQSDGSLTPLATTPLTPLIPLQIGGGLVGSSVYGTDPLGRAIYVLSSAIFPCSPLQSWAIDTDSGLLNLLGSVNSDLACISWSISFSPDGKYAYYGTLKKFLEMPTIYKCPLDPTTGKLIFDGTVANVPGNGTANYTQMMFEPSQGRFVIVTNTFVGTTSASSNLSSVPYDPATGDLGAAVFTMPIPYGGLLAVVTPNQ